MGKYRTPSEKSKYYLPKHTYLHVLHWCLQYKDWAAELSVLPDTSKGITYDKERVQTSNSFDATQDTAIKRAELAEKKELLEQTIREVDASIYDYLLLSIGYGFTEYQLKDKGMPCGHRYFSERRQRVYYLVNQRI